MIFIPKPTRAFFIFWKKLKLSLFFLLRHISYLQSIMERNITLGEVVHKQSNKQANKSEQKKTKNKNKNIEHRVGLKSALAYDCAQRIQSTW